MNLNTSNEFVGLVFQCLEGNAKIEACVETLIFFQNKWRLKIVIPPYRSLPDFPEWYFSENSPETIQLWNTHIFGSLYGFLTDTELILNPLYHSLDSDIEFDDSYLLAASPKGAGGIYADWANGISWLRRDDWSYIDFYNGSIADDYLEWEKVAYDVVKLANRTI